MTTRVGQWEAKVHLVFYQKQKVQNKEGPSN
jgi:hypothetical protein